jgi:DHA2 family multidrug resistance protein
VSLAADSQDGDGPDADQPAANRGLVTAGIMLATLMNTLDSTIANVALPHIQGSLSASPDQIGWVLTSYIVASAMTTPLSGWLSTRFGIKRVLMVAIAGFTTASVLCGFATSLPELVLFRMIQGAAGAFSLPLAQAVLLDINPPRDHAKAMSLWAMGTILGPIVGPVLGGWLTETFSWRWCFNINLPVGVVAFVLLLLFMRDEPRRENRRFDTLGFSTLILAVGALQLMLDRGPGQDWFASAEIWAEGLISLGAFWVFLTHTMTTRHPFVDLALTRDRNLMATAAFSFISGGVMFGTIAILPILVQSLMGYPVMTSGMISMPRGIAMFLTMWLMPRLTTWFDMRLMMFIGLVGNAISLWQMMHFDLTMSSGPLIASGIFQGAAQGMLFVPVTTLAFATIKPEMRAEASALYNLIRSVGSSIGISVLQAKATAGAQAAHAAMAAHITPADPVVRWSLERPFSPDTTAGLAALDAQIGRQSMMMAYLDDFRLLFVLTLVSAPLILFLRATRKAPVDPAHMALD